MSIRFTLRALFSTSINFQSTFTSDLRRSNSTQPVSYPFLYTYHNNGVVNNKKSSVSYRVSVIVSDVLDSRSNLSRFRTGFDLLASFFLRLLVPRDAIGVDAWAPVHLTDKLQGPPWPEWQMLSPLHAVGSRSSGPLASSSAATRVNERHPIRLRCV